MAAAAAAAAASLIPAVNSYRPIPSSGLHVAACVEERIANMLANPWLGFLSSSYRRRALPIRVLTVGKKRSPGVQLIVDEYLEKLRHYCRVDDVRIKSNPKNARDVPAQIEHESMSVIGVLRPDDWVVMVDERGVGVCSEEMASLIVDAGNMISAVGSENRSLFDFRICPHIGGGWESKLHRYGELTFLPLPSGRGEFGVLHRRALWAWTASARASKYVDQVVIFGLKSRGCVSRIGGANLQGMDHSQGTKLSSLDGKHAFLKTPSCSKMGFIIVSPGKEAV